MFMFNEIMYNVSSKWNSKKPTMYLHSWVFDFLKQSKFIHFSKDYFVKQEPLIYVLWKFHHF